METCSDFDLVVVPFPFTDRTTRKRRPAVVLSTEAYMKDTGNLVCAMVTTATRSSWKSDVQLKDWERAGLPKPSFVRMKLFTLDRRILIRRLGKLSKEDRARVRESLSGVMA